MFKLVAIMTLTALPCAAVAQHAQPYSGLDQRAIKALSDQQIADLKAGRGMSLALPAELNGYPGPAHVLEHADELGLTAAQREKTDALFAAMKAEAVPVGEQLIAQETHLDHLFAAKRITPASLTAATAQIGATQARLRETHLKYHLAMIALLSAEQIDKYRMLRGYGAGQHHPQHHN
jgi:Spy/CpxP family protein refolding chaperone